MEVRIEAYKFTSYGRKEKDDAKFVSFCISSLHYGDTFS